MGAYRSRSRLAVDLLAAIKDEGPVGVTRLLLVANLTHGKLQEMLRRPRQSPSPDDGATGARPRQVPSRDLLHLVRSPVNHATWDRTAPAEPLYATGGIEARCSMS